MPQHREVDPKNLGISPEDEAIQEFVDQAGQTPDKKNDLTQEGDKNPDEADDNEE